ncbi:MAG: NUDIX domain-containing protein [Gammaproteobacteria bacterium]|nr:NUDIX domain-containing protein [Gammaproteobacteria bacterium]
MSAHYCPQCGQQAFTSQDNNCYQCSHCQFEVFRNVAAAVGVILVYQQQVLLVKRSKAPAAGEWDLPGGFVNPDESAEQALRRECREETGIDPGESLQYLGAWPNQYPYKTLVYPTMDIFFAAELDRKPACEVDNSEVSGFSWRSLSDCAELKLAFPSAQHALKRYLSLSE